MSSHFSFMSRFRVCCSFVRHMFSQRGRSLCICMLGTPDAHNQNSCEQAGTTCMMQIRALLESANMGNFYPKRHQNNGYMTFRYKRCVADSLQEFTKKLHSYLICTIHVLIEINHTVCSRPCFSASADKLMTVFRRSLIIQPHKWKRQFRRSEWTTSALLKLFLERRGKNLDGFKNFR